MTWPIPAILCRPSYFIVFYCIYCWTGQLRCKSSLSDIIIIIIIITTTTQDESLHKYRLLVRYDISYSAYFN